MSDWLARQEHDRWFARHEHELSESTLAREYDRQVTERAEREAGVYRDDPDPYAEDSYDYPDPPSGCPNCGEARFDLAEGGGYYNPFDEPMEIRGMLIGPGCPVCNTPDRRPTPNEQSGERAPDHFYRGGPPNPSGVDKLKGEGG